jgi:hypothetical protein
MAALPWLSDRFFADVDAMARRCAMAAEDLLVVWTSESGLNPAAHNPNGGAQGLNQMMPATLKGLGMKEEEIPRFLTLSAEAQLPWIERLLVSTIGYLGQAPQSAAVYYAANFYPRSVKERGTSPAAVLVARDAEGAQERGAYEANKALDLDRDGRITIGDLAEHLDMRVVRGKTWPGVLERLRAVRGGVVVPPSGTSSTSAPSISVGPVLLAGGVLAFAMGVSLLKATRRRRWTT